MLVRLLYASRAVDTSPAVVSGILASARQHNQANGITGVLAYGGGVFMQAIEGGRQTVSELYGTIQRDPRHKDVLLLHFEEILERRFGGWSMGLVDVGRVNASVLLKYSERAVLDPYAVSGKVSMETYVELGLGVGLVASIAFEAERDTGLRAIDAGGLFGINMTRLAVRKGTYLRGYVYAFIESFAPTLGRAVVERSLAGESDGQDAVSLYDI